jgi:hypothetical protein
MNKPSTTHLLQINTVCNTTASGFWTHAKKPVKVTELELVVNYVDGAIKYGEVRVHFDEGCWNEQIDGLIFSDKNFLHELKEALKSKGMPAAEYLSYGAKDEQGKTFVQLDCDKAFITEFMKLCNKE